MARRLSTELVETAENVILDVEKTLIKAPGAIVELEQKAPNFTQVMLELENTMASTKNFLDRKAQKSDILMGAGHNKVVLGAKATVSRRTLAHLTSKAEAFTNQMVLKRLLGFLEDPRFESFLLFLVMMDVLFVLVEAILDLTFDSAAAHRRLESAAHVPSCLGKPELAQDISGACRIGSLVILFTFFVELFLRLVLAPAHHVKHFGFMLDVVVVTLSLIFEFTLHHTSGSLLLLFRLWRVVRILHGLYEHVEHALEAQHTEELLHKTLEDLKKTVTFIERHGLSEKFSNFKSSKADMVFISSDDVGHGASDLMEASRSMRTKPVENPNAADEEVSPEVGDQGAPVKMKSEELSRAVSEHVNTAEL